MQQNTNSTHKIKATNEQIGQMLEYYQGYLEDVTSKYTIARARLANCTITIYRTNVVLFQGLNEAIEYNKWAKIFNLPLEQVENKEHIDYSNLCAIGTDEVGTGDYFGPIVVCATFTTKEAADKLRHLGVKDSKLLTDSQMIPMAIKITNIVPYALVVLSPEKINSLASKFDNLNFIKSYLHNKAINSILKKIGDVKYDAILIDEFTPKDKYLKYLENQENVIKDVTCIVKGEKAHIGIAAASIIARAAFLRELKKLSLTYKMELYKGAGPEVDHCACSFIRSYGFKELKNVAKIKYANTLRIVEYFKNNPLPKSKIEGLIEIKQKLKIS